ncbi:putative DNA mismatch repair protein MSH3 [Melia azedarach]|uniref:DNA mismatch repair protein MSH3 n=2 Tax=Melia azedarach TaxID=155640 RepID=A0ACC1X4L1_MELAZ|nr:putative DNA mismatch repair protein MSH3 [Melia azedarach]KAJ4706054.1 putative DNA mismatch repair protein MSH3 [Melia azedarach]
MGKQKQQVISRFFAAKPKTTTPSSSSSSPPAPLSQPPPRIAATVSFSPAKRKVVSTLFRQTPKKPRLSPHTLNPTPSLPKLPDPSSNVPQSSNKKYTPLEQQVVDLKNKYPDVLLMIEVGYKYRFFGEDAEIAAKVLGIYAHMDHNFMTASVPTFRLNVHMRRLVSAGYKVGVVKQTETAAIKAHGPGRIGPFGRGLSALYTKATLEAAEDMGGSEDGCGGESNYLVCFVDDNVGKNSSNNYSDGFDVKIGVVAVEISTGDVVYGEFSDGFLRNGLETVLLSLSPAELLLAQPLSKQTTKLLLAYAGSASNVRVERASRDCFRGGGALAEVMSLYENRGAENLSNNENLSSEVLEKGNFRSGIEGIMNMPDLAVQALALTIRHLKQFGYERMMYLGASFRPLSSSTEMTLSANTLQQLEVLRNNSNGSESGSLLHIMNYTLTVYGSRLLRRWVIHPLCDKNLISTRLDAVSEIAESMGSYKTSECVGELSEENSDVTIVEPQFYYILSSVLTSLGRSPDIQRGITRIFHRTASASEFIVVIQAILFAGKKLQRLRIDEECEEKVSSKTVNSPLLKKLILTASSATVVGKAAKLLSTLNKEAADQGDLLNLLIISNGQFPEVARARKAVQSAKEELDSLICLCRKQLGMRNLEFMSVSGTTHLIELPVDFKVPLNWVKINSTKKTIRYHSPEVITALDQLALANEELAIVCRAAWDSFLSGFGEYYAEFQAAVQALASLDCLHALATLSRNKNYVRPVFVNNNQPVQIHICSGRHPVLDTILQDNFVPNDTNLHAEREYCQIITGPNMGGKSCYIRQVALIAIMAQVGSFVPASSAELHVLDGIYTRMGASDSIQQGTSTFLEELSEASHILRNCTAHSLVILDELGRGTSTHDGVAIAYATLHHLLKHKNCMVLFVTHYPKIADIRTEFPGSVRAYHVSYLTSHKVTDTVGLKSDQDVTYLYKLVPGVSEKSFGFKVAELAQLPPSCISRATIMAARLEAEVSSRVQKRLVKCQLLETSSDQEQEAQGNMLATPDNFHTERVEGLEDLISTYQDLFLNLKFATHDDNPAKSFQFLKHARSIAKELLIR